MFDFRCITSLTFSFEYICLNSCDKPGVLSNSSRVSQRLGVNWSFAISDENTAVLALITGRGPDKTVERSSPFPFIL